MESGQEESPAGRLHSKLSDVGLQDEIDALSSGEEDEEELYDEENDDESQDH